MADTILYKILGNLWEITLTNLLKNGRPIINIIGPLCPTCKTEIKFSYSDIWKQNGVCAKCEKKFTFKDADELRSKALVIYEAKQREGLPILTLDLPPTHVIAEDNEDKNYWLQAKIGQKEGKKMAVVYFGEKIHGKQSKDDYAQLFVDLDDEQVRFDKGNKNPMKLLSKLTAEFEGSTLKINKKAKK